MLANVIETITYVLGVVFAILLLGLTCLVLVCRVKPEWADVLLPSNRYGVQLQAQFTREGSTNAMRKSSYHMDRLLAVLREIDKINAEVWNYPSHGKLDLADMQVSPLEPTDYVVYGTFRGIQYRAVLMTTRDETPYLEFGESGFKIRLNAPMLSTDQKYTVGQIIGTRKALASS